MPDAVAAFLADLYELHGAGKTDGALDLIFRWVDDQLKDGSQGVARCDSALSAVDVDRLDEDLLVGLLTATHAGFLPTRPAFADRVRDRLAAEIGADTASTLVNELSSVGPTLPAPRATVLPD